MEMILLDWTRMGKGYCLAGAAYEDGQFRIVRPLLRKGRADDAHRVGWSPYLLDGHSRWEVFELIGAEPASCIPPHTEDLWVRAMRPMRRFADVALRRSILAQTTVPVAEGPFGTPLFASQTSAYLIPGTGSRSLVTIRLPADVVHFEVSSRPGVRHGAMRVHVPLHGQATTALPVTDHHLLWKIEKAFPNVGDRARGIAAMVRSLGNEVALRLGVSRPFSSAGHATLAMCWVMANGFFSLTEPRP